MNCLYQAIRQTHSLQILLVIFVVFYQLLQVARRLWIWVMIPWLIYLHSGFCPHFSLHNRLIISFRTEFMPTFFAWSLRRAGMHGFCNNLIYWVMKKGDKKWNRKGILAWRRVIEGVKWKMVNRGMKRRAGRPEKNWKQWFKWEKKYLPRWDSGAGWWWVWG